MGNRLTVGNAADIDVYVAVDIDKMAVTDIKTDVGMQQLKPTADVTYDVKPVDIKLGTVAIASQKSLKFPKLASGRYYVTITAKGWADLICNRLLIPWRTNIIVTPEKKLAFAKSGTVWIDQSDGSDYTPQRKTSKPETSKADGLKEDRCAAAKAGDSVDGIPTDVENVSLQEAAKILKQSSGLPKYVARLFLSQGKEEMTSNDVSSLACDVDETKRLLSEKASTGGIQLITVAGEGQMEVDKNALKNLLQQEPFHMDSPEVEFVVAELLANEKRQRKTAQLLHQLNGNQLQSSTSVN